MNSKCNNEIEYSIIKKYFEDTATDEEKNSVTGWLNNPESIFKIESCIRLLWNEMDPDANDPSIDLNALLDKIHHTINLTGKKEKTRSLTESSKPVISFYLVLRNIARIAAIMLFPLMAYLGWEVYSQKMWMKKQTEIVYNEIICPLGARSQFELPDGTKKETQIMDTIVDKDTGDLITVNDLRRAQFEVFSKISLALRYFTPLVSTSISCSFSASLNTPLYMERISKFACSFCTLFSYDSRSRSKVLALLCQLPISYHEDLAF